MASLIRHFTVRRRYLFCDIEPNGRISKTKKKVEFFSLLASTVRLSVNHSSSGSLGSD